MATWTTQNKSSASWTLSNKSSASFSNINKSIGSNWDWLLMETGNYLYLEDGSRIILEQTTIPIVWSNINKS